MNEMIQVICLDRLFVEEKDAVRGVLCTDLCLCVLEGKGKPLCGSWKRWYEGQCCSSITG